MTPGCKAQPIACFVFNAFNLFAALSMTCMFLFYRAAINTHCPLMAPFLIMMIATISTVYIPFVCQHPSVTWVMIMAFLHEGVGQFTVFLVIIQEKHHPAPLPLH